MLNSIPRLFAAIFEQRMPISTDAPGLSGLLVGPTRWWRISFPGVREEFFEFRSGLFLGSVVTGLFCRFQLFLRFHFWALALGHVTSSTAVPRQFSTQDTSHATLWAIRPHRVLGRKNRPMATRRMGPHIRDGRVRDEVVRVTQS